MRNKPEQKEDWQSYILYPRSDNGLLVGHQFSWLKGSRNFRAENLRIVWHMGLVTRGTFRLLCVRQISSKTGNDNDRSGDQLSHSALDSRL